MNIRLDQTIPIHTFRLMCSDGTVKLSLPVSGLGYNLFRVVRDHLNEEYESDFDWATDDQGNTYIQAAMGTRKVSNDPDVAKLIDAANFLVLGFASKFFPINRAQCAAHAPKPTAQPEAASVCSYRNCSDPATVKGWNGWRCSDHEASDDAESYDAEDEAPRADLEAAEPEPTEELCAVKGCDREATGMILCDVHEPSDLEKIGSKYSDCEPESTAEEDAPVSTTAQPVADDWESAVQSYTATRKKVEEYAANAFMTGDEKALRRITNVLLQGVTAPTGMAVSGG